MAIPRQAEEAGELAEKLHEQMFQGNPPESDVVENDGEPEQDIPEQNEPEEQDPEEEKYKSRYMSLKGKYDAEVPRLQRDLQELKQSVIERLSQTNLQQTVKEEEKPEDVNPLLEKFKEEYGEDLLEAIKQITRMEVDPLVKQSVKPVQEQVSSVEETQIKAAQQNFVNHLDTIVKTDWRAITAGYQEMLAGQAPSDPKIAAFLTAPDPSGLYTNAELIHNYNNNWDADKLAIVFNMYEAAKPKVQSKQNTQDQNAMIAPSKNNVHSSPNISDARIWTKEAQEQFVRDDRAGKYSSEESLAMWNDLMLAPSQGRMR